MKCVTYPQFSSSSVSCVHMCRHKTPERFWACSLANGLLVWEVCGIDHSLRLLRRIVEKTARTEGNARRQRSLLRIAKSKHLAPNMYLHYLLTYVFKRMRDTMKYQCLKPFGKRYLKQFIMIIVPESNLFSDPIVASAGGWPRAIL